MERLLDLETRIAPTLEAMGFEVVRVALTGGSRTLQVMADRRDGAAVTVDDCEAISTALSAIFDVEEPVKGMVGMLQRFPEGGEIDPRQLAIAGLDLIDGALAEPVAMLEALADGAR